MDFRRALSGAIRAGYCSLLAGNEYVARAGSRMVRRVPVIGATSAAYVSALGAYRRLVCPAAPDNPYGAPPNPVYPPPRPGQCPVQYNGTVTYDAAPLGQDIVRNWALLGPNPRPLITGSAIGETTTIRMISDVAQGPILTSYQITASRPPISLDGFTIVRTDGQPDECPGQEPGDPPYIEDPFPYDPPNGGPPIIIAPRIIFLDPTLEINGNITVPIEINLPDLNINASFNLGTGDICFNFFGGICDNDPCQPPVEIPNPPPPGPEGPPQEPGTAYVKGVVVVSTLSGPTPGSTQVFATDGPDYFLPELGVISFLVKVGVAAAWTQPIRIQHSRQVVQCPIEEGAIDWALNPRNGVSMQGFSYYDRLPTVSPR